jgi:putative membrane protein
VPKNHSEPNVWKGALAGLVAGLVASWAMNRFQDVWVSFSSSNDSTSESKSSDNDRETANSNNKRSDNESEDDATVRAASSISEGVFNHELTADEKKIAGPAVHYATGAAGGLVYGVAAELAPEITEGVGLPYGAAFWLVVDEGLVPLLGFAKGPSEYPLSAHAYALASHLVFGATAEGVRRLLRG